MTGLDACWTVADIGSGTGNVTRHLVGRVARAFAVEPDDAMRTQAERLLGAYPSFISIAGAAEETTLLPRSVDLITVGQALHWFDLERAKREFDRILKPGGWLALLWDRFGEETEPDLSTFFLQDECKRLSFPITIHERWPQFIGGARSSASNPSQGDDGYEEFEQKQRNVFDARAVNGVIAIHYTTKLAVGRFGSRTTGCELASFFE
ncbi:MAG: class I SAM-dependent methyltransferase [Coprothermobacterota bacterium]|nr:class I SAM-dependent methyltransferase [Coprothermobacterota bacterium]